MEPFLKCIRTSIEYQILESIRLKLRIGERKLQAPQFEMDEHGLYYRHCRLIVRERGLDAHWMPSPLYLGLHLKKMKMELYFTRGVYYTRGGTRRFFDGNCVYGVADLCDSRCFSIVQLKRWIKLALDRADTLGNEITEKKPLYKIKMVYPTVGPYIWTEPKIG